MKKIIALLLLLLLFTGCAFFPEDKKELSPPEVKDAVHLQYNVEKAVKMNISDIKEFTGEFVYSYYKQYNILAMQALGFPQNYTVLVKDGQTVNENDILIQFNTLALDESIAHANVNLLELNSKLQTENDKDYIKAQIEEAKIAKKALEDKKKEYSVKASFSGKIRFNYDNPQNEADKKVTEIVLYQEDGISLAIDANNYAKTLKVGEKGTVSRLGGETLSYEGTVRRVPQLTSNGYSPDDKDYLIVSDGEFKYEDKATFTVITATHENAICIPARALKQYKSDDYFVRILSADGITRKEVLVKVGIINADYAEILEGVDEGDTVIVG